MAQEVITTDLMRRIAAGDKRALQMVYASESAKMLGVVMRIVKNRERAEDVVQETFVRIWRKASMYSSDLGSPKSWIYAMCRNLALNNLRDERHIATDDGKLFALVDAPDNHETAFERLGDDKALKKCLERLDEMPRKGLMLAYVEGYSHGEIADKLNMPLGTVKTWIRRSLLSLKECLS